MSFIECSQLPRSQSARPPSFADLRPSLSFASAFRVFNKRPTPLAICILAIITCTIQAARAKDLESLTDDDIIQAVEAATREFRATMRHFTATGSYKNWHDGKLIYHSSFRVERSDGKYHMELTHQRDEDPRPPRFSRIELVCDGQSLFATRFSERIHPAGCVTTVRKESRDSLAVVTGMEVNPAALDRVHFPKPDKIFDSNMTVIRRGVRVVLRFRPKGYDYIVTEIEASANVDFNVLRVESHLRPKNGEHTSHQRVYDWVQSNGKWIIKKLRRTVDWPDGIYVRETAYNTVDIGAKVDEDRFTLEALEPCSNSRLIDHRPDSTVNFRTVNTETNADKLETIAAQVKALPARVPVQDPLITDPETSRMLSWLIAFNVGLLVILGGIVGFRRYRSRHSGS